MRKIGWMAAGALALGLVITPVFAQDRTPSARTAQGEGADVETPPVLQPLAGVLEKTGESYAVNGTEVGFGAEWYIADTTASADYSGDGSIQTIAAEVDGLVGREVTLEGEYGKKGDFDVFAIGDAAYRDPKGGRPPWAGPPPWAGQEQDDKPDTTED